MSCRTFGSGLAPGRNGRMGAICCGVTTNDPGRGVTRLALVYRHSPRSTGQG